MHILSLWARAGLGGENLAFFSRDVGFKERVRVRFFDIFPVVEFYLKHLRLLELVCTRPAY
jgi:hypothetical protein